MAGDHTGTLVGIYPKIVCTFRKLNQQELGIIAPILDSERQYVQYFDATKQEKITMLTYSGDWKEVSKNIGKVEGIQCSFVSSKKRR